MIQELEAIKNVATSIKTIEVGAIGVVAVYAIKVAFDAIVKIKNRNGNGKKGACIGSKEAILALDRSARVENKINNVNETQMKQTEILNNMAECGVRQETTLTKVVELLERKP